MAIKKSQQKAVNKYIKNHYDRINLFTPAGRKNDIQARADDKKQSVNNYICELIRADLGLSPAAWAAAPAADQDGDEADEAGAGETDGGDK